MHFTKLNTAVATVTVALGVAHAQETGHHTDWPRWCGKVYQPEYPSFDPGGQTVEPERLYDPPRLDVRFSPALIPYVEGDETAGFAVDALLSPYRGVEWPSSIAEQGGEEGGTFFYTIYLMELVEEGGEHGGSSETQLVSSSMPANSREGFSEFSLSLENITSLAPSMEPYDVMLRGGRKEGSTEVEATSKFWYLPRKENGSVTIVDQNTGGLWHGTVESPASSHTGNRNDADAKRPKSKPLIPYGFYASYDGFLAEDDAIEAIDNYANRGLNAMCPLTRYDESKEQLDYMEDIGLYVLFDLREIYKNLTAVEEAVLLARDAKNLWGYWLADDRPDGHQDAFDLGARGYSLLKTLDPYHPVIAVLNCQNYYYPAYSSPADIVIPDAYPMGTSYELSKWGTACNATYGDCGCDNCAGEVADVASRLDRLARYDEWIGGGGQPGRWRKPRMFSPQSFHGEGYWERDPGPQEAWAMSLLALNHGAKGIISWVWPTADALAQAHGELSKVVTREPVSDFLVRASPLLPVVTTSSNESLGVDAAYWALDGREEMLVSIVNTNPCEMEGLLMLEFPGFEVLRVKQSLWGNISAEEWTMDERKVGTVSLPGMATCLLLLSITDSCQSQNSRMLKVQIAG
ncbi:hypothetical protein MKZ38_001490 [Zalerion maritima]|uniref:Uncharacterized protein n=1 Tax=Zalerion maritima TaxID=339359 RepID=A0AAD5RZ68_9PEZI|nr:hypothetical protein MKZ38_001490 [Zalerion maritima]